MKRYIGYFTAAIIFCLMLLTLSVPAARTAKAARMDQSCEKCQSKVQERYDKCIARNPSNAVACGDEFNLGIVHCYATVCEG